MVQLRGLVDTLANASINASNAGLVRSVLACGFYPLVGRLLPVKGNQGGPRSKAMIVTAKGEKVRDAKVTVYLCAACHRHPAIYLLYSIYTFLHINLGCCTLLCSTMLLISMVMNCIMLCLDDCITLCLPAVVIMLCVTPCGAQASTIFVSCCR